MPIWGKVGSSTDVPVGQTTLATAVDQKGEIADLSPGPRVGTMSERRVRGCRSGRFETGRPDSFAVARWEKKEPRRLGRRRGSELVTYFVLGGRG